MNLGQAIALQKEFKEHQKHKLNLMQYADLVIGFVSGCICAYIVLVVMPH